MLNFILNSSHFLDSTFFQKLSVFSRIKFISWKQCYPLKLEINRFLFLDIKSYNKLYTLFPTEKCYLYNNNKLDMKKEIHYPLFMYGYYSEYQEFNIKEKLCLYFDLFKSFDPPDSNTWFVSSIDSKLENIRPFIQTDNFIFKIHSRSISLYSKFSNFLYIQAGGLDTNNRLIPEVKFYNRNLEVIFLKEEYKKDSIYDRYINTWQSYSLEDDNKLIMDILRD